jgi:O-antigen/teichoic acid export membrane protein
MTDNSKPVSQSDQTGQKHLGKNVVASWTSQLIFIVFGFVLPRAIEEAVGQVSLGIWDFGWSIVSYLRLSMMGIGASVNRYVARYRASSNNAALSHAVCSVMAVQAAVATAVFLATVLISHLVPTVMGEKLGAETDVAATIVLLLGSSLAITMAFNTFRGVLTGCHRWGIHNALEAGGYTITAVLMLTVLAMGKGLVGMATVYLAMTFVTELARAAVARAVCPEIKYQWQNVKWDSAVEMVGFGIRQTLIFLPKNIVQYTVSILVVANLGAAMLAILARPVALVAHIWTMINKFAFVLTPTAGSMQELGIEKELRSLALKAMRAGWIFALLPTVFLAVFGDRVIELWMGPSYADLKLIQILVLGSVFPLAQTPLVTVMVGMNRHGAIAKYCLIMTAVSATVGFAVASQFEWSLAMAALLITIPNNLGIGLSALIIGCRVLVISPAQYFRSVLMDPLVLFLVAGMSLVAVRLFGPQGLVPSLCIAALVLSLVSIAVLRNDMREVIAHFSGEDQTGELY